MEISSLPNKPQTVWTSTILPYSASGRLGTEVKVQVNNNRNKGLAKQIIDKQNGSSSTKA